MPIKYLLLVFSLLSFPLLGQYQGKIANYSHFQLRYAKDSIDFVIADTMLSEKKPLLLFCQGSQPVPLFISFKDYGILPITLNNFDLKELNKHFHVAVISMPKTPIIAEEGQLNRSFNYITDSSNQHSYAFDYLEADYLENYVERANRVIRFLMKQPWVDASDIVVAGHSQGSRVAVELAAKNKKIVALGLFGYNPMRRIDQQLWTLRKKAERGEISWQEVDSLQKELYQFYKQIQDKSATDKDPSLKSWKSFSNISFETLANLDIPVYIAYGSQDEVADCNDLIPMYFIEKGKKNYQLVRYPNLEHNFFPVVNGKTDYENGRWKEVMNAFVLWTR